MVVSQNTLKAFWEEHSETKASLTILRAAIKGAEWKSPLEVVRTFPKAKALNAERVRFEVAGGNYRMIIAFDFEREIAFIKFRNAQAVRRG